MKAVKTIKIKALIISNSTYLLIMTSINFATKNFKVATKFSYPGDQKFFLISSPAVTSEKWFRH